MRTLRTSWPSERSSVSSSVQCALSAAVMIRLSQNESLSRVEQSIASMIISYETGINVKWVQFIPIPFFTL